MFFTVSLKTDNSMKVTFDVDSFKPTVKTLFREKKKQVGVLAGLFRACLLSEEPFLWQGN